VPLAELRNVSSYKGFPKDPARQFFFIVRFPDDLVKIDESMVKSVSELPLWAVTQNTQFQGRDRSNYPDKRSIGDISITFYELVDDTVKKFFLGWSRKMIDENGIYGLPKDWRKWVEIETLDCDNKVVAVRRYSVMPLRIHGMGMDQGGEALVTPTVDFSVDGYETLKG
jgi:hypothetical protein